MPYQVYVPPLGLARSKEAVKEDSVALMRAYSKEVRLCRSAGYFTGPFPTSKLPVVLTRDSIAGFESLDLKPISQNILWLRYFFEQVAKSRRYV
jgi:hypothetical protein